MIASFGEIHLAERGDGRPAILASGSAPGESGVSILSVQFRGSAHIDAKARWHLIFFTSGARFACRIAGRSLRHDAPAGSLAICPCGADALASTDASVGSFLVAVDAGRLALAAAEDYALDARLEERLTGYDVELLEIGRTLISESAGGYPSGPLFWNEAASRFVDRLVACHIVPPQDRARGTLGNEVLARLRDHVMAHLDEPIEVASLARIAGRSPFHFSRVFAQSVGMTPHRYVVHLRLQRAIDMMREGRTAPAEIAVRTGFADQSHLARWVRRVHGVPLGRFAV